MSPPPPSLGPPATTVLDVFYDKVWLSTSTLPPLTCCPPRQALLQVRGTWPGISLILALSAKLSSRERPDPHLALRVLT